MDGRAGGDPRALEGRGTQGHGPRVSKVQGSLGLTWGSWAQGTDEAECLLAPEWVWPFGVGVLGWV